MPVFWMGLGILGILVIFGAMAFAAGKDGGDLAGPMAMGVGMMLCGGAVVAGIVAAIALLVSKLT